MFLVVNIVSYQSVVVLIQKVKLRQEIQQILLESYCLLGRKIFFKGLEINNIISIIVRFKGCVICWEVVCFNLCLSK